MPALPLPVRQRQLRLFESTRYARGHKALYTFEINGEKGSLKWDLHDLHRAPVFPHSDEGNVRGWRSITSPTATCPTNWWVPGLQIDYEHTFVHQVADFLQNLSSGKPTSPTFREALATQAVCDAVLDSAEAKKWENVVPDPSESTQYHAPFLGKMDDFMKTA